MGLRILRRLKGIFLLCWGIGATNAAFAQHDSTFWEKAREDIAYLCGEGLAGRGYTAEGHIRAAHFLADQFQAAGLHPLMADTSVQNGYLQAFTFPLNLVQDAYLAVDDQVQELGADFIPFLLTGSDSVRASVTDVGYGLEPVPAEDIRGQLISIREGWPAHIKESDSLQEQFQDKKQVWNRITDLLYAQPAGILIGRKKLTAGYSSQSVPIPMVEYQWDSLPQTFRSASLVVNARQGVQEAYNVVGMIPGTKFPDSALVLSAHYDHLGKVGDVYFPGANDNASGIALLLSLLRHFAQEENRLPYSLVFIAFGGEETGLRGSQYYVEAQPLFPLAKTQFVLNLDLMGNGEKGIMAVGGKDYPAFFDHLVLLNEAMQSFSVVKARPNAPNSDHYFFLKKGIPGFFIYTMGGPPHYHDIWDRPDALRLSHFYELRSLFIAFLKSF